MSNFLGERIMVLGEERLKKEGIHNIGLADAFKKRYCK